MVDVMLLVDVLSLLFGFIELMFHCQETSPVDIDVSQDIDIDWRHKRQKLMPIKASV